jgi:hypothetical protein
MLDLHIGVSSMLLYYCFFHPVSPITLCPKQLQHSMECGNSPCLPDLNTEQMATLRSLKHCWQTDKNGCLTRYSSLVQKQRPLSLCHHLTYLSLWPLSTGQELMYKFLRWEHPKQTAMVITRFTCMPYYISVY